MLLLPFPTIDPILLQIGPIAIRWYGLAYVVGIMLGWLWVRRRMAKECPQHLGPSLDNYLTYAILGIVLGGRLGYATFYNPSLFSKPLQLVAVWEGGMAFHGGMIGLLVATLLFCTHSKIPFSRFADLLARAAPIGIFFGRIANFINGELYGRVTDVPWAIVFPSGGTEPRHPSQLYEAGLEGILLFLLCNLLGKNQWIKKQPGRLSGVFLVGYGCVRVVVECFRQPDVQLGLYWDVFTLGQILSVPLILAGFYLLIRKPQTLDASTKNS